MIVSIVSWLPPLTLTGTVSCWIHFAPVKCTSDRNSFNKTKSFGYFGHKSDRCVVKIKIHVKSYTVKDVH